MKKVFFGLCIAMIIAIVAFSVYQSKSRTDIDRVNQALFLNLSLENGLYETEQLMASLPDDVRKAIVDVVPDHNAFDTHTGTWLVTRQDFATKQGIFLSTKVIPEIPKARNLGFAIEPLGNVNGVYTYLLQYYWD